MLESIEHSCRHRFVDRDGAIVVGLAVPALLALGGTRWVCEGRGGGGGGGDPGNRRRGWVRDVAQHRLATSGERQRQQ